MEQEGFDTVQHRIVSEQVLRFVAEAQAKAGRQTEVA